jgi:transcriptional regulator with XRE-family HTH domain
MNPHGRPREAERPRTPAAARDLKQTLATNLRRLRIARGLTQSELGAKAGITRAHLNRLERGAFNASLDTVSRLAAALGVAPLKLLKMPKERR